MGMAAVVAHIGQFDDFLDLFSKKIQKFSANSSNCPYFEWGVVWRKNHGYITKNIYTQQQLKRKTMKRLKILLSCAMITGISTVAVGFDSHEHKHIGDQINIFCPLSIDPNTALDINSRIPAGFCPLPFPNQLNLTMGQIIALAGDFYGLPYKGAFWKTYTPIESIADRDLKLNNLYQPVTDAEKGRFITAFNSLYESAEALLEVNKIVAIFSKVEQASITGEKYDPTCDYEFATGATVCVFGIPSPSDDFNGRYLKLAENNIDHFGIHAIRSYIIGHSIALECAQQIPIDELSHESGQHRFARCLALDGYAQHFLTDIHSGGHIRTPRVELMNSISPYSATVAGLLAKCMHDEDSELGVETSNAQQDSWLAYGDDQLLSDKAKKQLSIIVETSQRSIDEVIDALLYKHAYPIMQYQALKVIPTTEDMLLDNSHTIGNTTCSPLFITDNPRSKVLRRSNIHDHEDFNWTENWSIYSVIKGMKS